MIVLMLCGLMFASPASADEDEVDEPAEEEVELDEATVRSAYLLLQLQQQLSQKTYEYNQIDDQIESAQDELVDVRESIGTLEEQIENLDSLIAESEAKIESVTSQIGSAETDLAKIMEDIEIRELQIQEQEKIVSELMKILYVKKNIYYDDGDDLSALKLILADGSVSDVMQNMVYLDLIEQSGEDIFEALKLNKENLEANETALEEKKVLLTKLEEELAYENGNLNAEMQGKQSLLAETEGKESIYQELLVLSNQQQEQIADEIANLRTNLELVESKFYAGTQVLSEKQIEEVLNIKAEALLNNGVVGASEFLQLDWPVSPKAKGLSAYFDDAGYVSAFGVAHRAIDIPVMQGTAINAPAEGVVYKIVYDEESIGYAYVMLAHRKGVVTVYGHVSAVAVKEGDYVYRGQIIGLSGGVPGTIGAGLRTTGAHLHFEVWQDGVLIDPLNYLDLTEIPIDTLREDYLERMQAQLEEEITEIKRTLESINY